MHEFELIEKYFKHLFKNSNYFPLDIGDDAALISPPPGYDLVTSIDTLTAGIHFPADYQPFDIGYKSLAISLSDIAAMGAEASGVLLALTLPQAEADWLKQFAAGFFTLANATGVDLIGGNISRGPLSISTTTFGWIKKGGALLRSGAQLGDDIYVTGFLGTAGLALQWQQKGLPLDEQMHQGFYRPKPRLAAGLVLQQHAHAAIDISDGLAADLQKLLIASGLGGSIEVKFLPIAQTVQRHCTPEQSWQLALTAGEDYELCFCAHPSKKEQLTKQLAAVDCPAHCIGKVTETLDLLIFSPTGKLITLDHLGYQHF